VLRCLAKRPADRLEGVRALRQALDQLDEADAWSEAEAETWWAAASSRRVSSVEPEATAFASTMQIDLSARP
jgi:hypothetical protein